MIKRRRFPVEIILVCVRWYCKCEICSRDLMEMMQERGVNWRSGFAGIGATVQPPGGWTRPFSVQPQRSWALSLPIVGLHNNAGIIP